MVDSVQIRRRGAQDFEAYYDYACAIQDSVPAPAVKAHLSRGMVDFNGDRIRTTDWTPILDSLCINKQLHHIAVSSSYQTGPGAGEAERYSRSSCRRKPPALRSRELTFRLCKALRESLSVSPNLRTLHLQGLPLREKDLITLTKGLAKSVSLENLSLANCPIGDEGLEAICQSVKYSPCIKTVDFTGCSLTWRGAGHMASIIKHQAMQRHSAAWAESLRYRKPEFEGMGGLRRVTLNANTLIGDRGAAALAQELAEDLWVKAVDLQKCGLSNKGARPLLEALKSNTALCVLDIRRNPLVDNDLVKTVIEKVLMNANSQPSQYSWIKPPALRDPQKPPGPRRRILGNTMRGKATFRIGPRKPPTASRRSPDVAHRPRPPRSGKGFPWRTAARAGRQRGLPPGIRVSGQSFEGAGTVKVVMETESEEDEDEEEEAAEETQKSSPALSRQERITDRQYKRLQVELEECRLRLAEERRARVRAEARLMEHELENARLRSTNFSLSEALQAQASGSSVLEEEAVLDSIESSFTKFHAFLDLLKDAGLGQLASMAGINQSDFGPLGRPQLSSTVGWLLEGAGPGAGDRDAETKADTVAPSGRDTPHAPSSGQPEGLTSGALASLRELLPEASPEEVLVPGREPAGGPCVAEPGGGQLDQQRTFSLKPEARHTAGSEHSLPSNSSHGSSSHGNNSHGSGSYGKGSPGNASHHSNGSCDDGSHGYPFNYSNGSHSNSSIHSNGSHSYGSIHSNGSHSNCSRGNASVRSSLSDRSDRVESLGSRGGGGGVEVKLYSGFEMLEQIRALGSLGGSDDGF